jgi:hypothetical protein
MNRVAIMSAVLLGAALIFSGCSKPEKPDSFVYTVNEYPLDQGFIHNYGMPEGATGYNFDVTIHSQGVSYNRDRHEFLGTGHLVFFQMFSSSATELSGGTYQFSTGDEAGAPFTFNVANFGMGVDFTNETGTIVSAVSGTVRVSGSGDHRTFDFECMTGTGEKITGHFNGWIPAYDMRGSGK